MKIRNETKADRKRVRVLILGVSGMLGNAMFRFFSTNKKCEVFGTIRSPSLLNYFPTQLRQSVITGIAVEDSDKLRNIFSEQIPDVVINCIGLVKQLSASNDALAAIPVNSLLPHRLAHLCEIYESRLIHISTDCVFSGSKGMYIESDAPDAKDLYGRSKLLGEVHYNHSVTLRTSIIGRELTGNRSLVSWFLSQTGQIKGFNKVFFSGLPTVELARVICNFVIPNGNLRGLYHVSAPRISKHELLKLIAAVYQKTIDIIPDETLQIDRSLNSDRFRDATGYVTPDWQTLIESMHEFN